jgi:hypothetical protein
MLTPKRAEVTFIPANIRESGMVEIRYGSLLHDKHPIRTIEFANVDDLATKIAAAASEFEGGRYASVTLLDGIRKPAGWDAKTRQLFYNLDAAS